MECVCHRNVWTGSVSGSLQQTLPVCMGTVLYGCSTFRTLAVHPLQGQGPGADYPFPVSDGVFYYACISFGGMQE